MAKAPGQHVSTATFLAQTALPSKDKKLPYEKPSQKWCENKWHASYFELILSSLIHIA